MIKWQRLSEEIPRPGAEIVAKNPLKPACFNTASKQCKIIKYNHRMPLEQVKELMLDDNLTLWAYTEACEL